MESKQFIALLNMTFLNGIKLKKSLLIAFIIILFFVLRIPALSSLTPEQVLGGDPEHYFLIAKNLLINGVYSESGNLPTESASWRPPVWPFLLSNYMALSLDFDTIMLIKLLSELILLLIAATIVFTITRKINIAIIVLFASVIEPQFIKYSTTLLSENLSALMILITSLLLVYIYTQNNATWVHYIFGILCGLILNTHPVAIFYVLFLQLSYSWLLLSSKTFIKYLPVYFIFLCISLAWPIRNKITFNQGYFITASQGATFSKGWNDSVPYLYTNTKGDLADEGLNLKYISDSIPIENQGILALKKLYTKATFTFIHQADYALLFNIIFVKLKSNFNPFPETPKPGKLELVGSIFRSMYLITLLSILFLAITNQSYFKRNRLFSLISVLIVLVFTSQAIMSIAIYTGLRFNAIYSLILVFCSLIFWLELWNNIKTVVK
jgi:4-amino-4-deoxy-L-arabinose transferase-like glycosyltransferase